MANFEDLLEELVIHIFSFLKLKDRKTTRLVCKKWHRLSYSLSLISQDVTIIKDYNQLDGTFPSFSRHVNVILACFEEGDLLRSVQFWTRHGRHIKYLQVDYHFFEIDDNCYTELSRVFPKCENLEVLNLLDVSEVMESSLFDELWTSFEFRKLLKVTLNVSPRFSIPLLKNFITNSPELEHIAIDCGKNSGTSANEYNLCLNTLVDLINKQALKLKALEVSECDIKNVFIKGLIKNIGPQLKTLVINDGDGTGMNETLSAIASKFAHLKELLLYYCNFNEAAFKKALVNLRQLTVISLYGSNIKDSGLAALKEVPNLSHLDLSTCFNISNEGIYQVLGHDVRPQMIELRLVFLTKITDRLISNIVMNLPNLQFLNLKQCESLTDKSLKAIFTHNLHLNCLSIEDCELMEDIYIGPSINALKELKHLNVYRTRVSFPMLQCLELPCIRVIDYGVGLLNKKDILEFPSLYAVNLCFQNEGAYLVKEKTSVLKCHSSPFGCCYMDYELHSNDGNDSDSSVDFGYDFYQPDENYFESD